MNRLLHNIGLRHNSNYNTAEEIRAAATDFLTFDGIYKTVWENRCILAGRSGILFVMGAYVGGDNSFDSPMPPERYCTWDQIVETASLGNFDIGWHTKTHRDLTTVPDDELDKELRPPFPMRAFAYPYGRFDERVIRAVKRHGFAEAWSVTTGDDSAFQRRRAYLNW